MQQLFQRGHRLASLCGEIFSKLKEQVNFGEFDSHWVFYFSDLLGSLLNSMMLRRSLSLCSRATQIIYL